MATIAVSIVGASGYIGTELLRLLLSHPKVDIQYVTSRQKDGISVAEEIPNFTNMTNLKYSNPSLQQVASDSDVIFFATGHTISMNLIPSTLETSRVIDMSGDFRLTDSIIYQQYYHKKHACPDLLPKAVYGLPELNRKLIKNATLLANPGCFPTGAILGILPLAENHLLGQNTYVNSITGSSGSGIVPSETTHHPIRANDIKPYKPGIHRHQPEIQQIINQIMGSDSNTSITFVPHSGPFIRGIYTSIYSTPIKDSTEIIPTDDLVKKYSKFYANEPFVRIREIPPRLNHVTHSNFCDISPTVISANSKETPKILNQIVVFCVLDNLIKGGAGQAIQNLNIMFNFPETTGLNQIPPYPP